MKFHAEGRTEIKEGSKERKKEKKEKKTQTNKGQCSSDVKVPVWIDSLIVIGDKILNYKNIRQNMKDDPTDLV